MVIICNSRVIDEAAKMKDRLFIVCCFLFLLISGCSTSSQSIVLAQARNSTFLAGEAKKDAAEYVEEIKRKNLELKKMLGKLRAVIESAESNADMCTGQS